MFRRRGHYLRRGGECIIIVIICILYIGFAKAVQ